MDETADEGPSLRQVTPLLDADNEIDSTTITENETAESAETDLVTIKSPSITSKENETEVFEQNFKTTSEKVPQKAITTTSPIVTTSRTSSSSSSSSSSSTSATPKTKPTRPSFNITTIPADISSKTSNITDSSDGSGISLFSSFNLNYLYFLLLLIPIGGIGIWVTFFCKRKKRKGYTEGKGTTRINKTRRMSTPSWVFSEPDFDDEEVITLEEEKK
ncbi:hypothetical protein Zmor_025411 [Zophobas morio]|uniref:Uncharacterized protein n=1 Tax=Zophobas morio TaxID=2755281 RepID=A0AA38HRH0_9CUCU|nr:hypothetical protein Zmor_025411 [Zophobas morio]